jgi:hypothetical protein
MSKPKSTVGTITPPPGQQDPIEHLAYTDLPPKNLLTDRAPPNMKDTFNKISDENTTRLIEDMKKEGKFMLNEGGRKRRKTGKKTKRKARKTRRR